MRSQVPYGRIEEVIPTVAIALVLAALLQGETGVPRANTLPRQGGTAVAQADTLSPQGGAVAPRGDGRQDGGEAAKKKPPLEGFRALEPQKKSNILSWLERRILLDSHPAIQRIVSLGPNYAVLPERKPRRFHDPAEWAKGVAPKRVLVKAGTEAHDLVRERIPPVAFLPRMHKAVYYDWAEGKIVRRARPLSSDEVFENLLNGFPPYTDAAVAKILTMLDNDDEERGMAAYLEHLYADLQARVYEGITMHEAWFSAQVIDVPDVDAIPFERLILKSKRFKSPIPRGPKRTWLYQQIRGRAFAFTKYRGLREAAAASFVAAKPRMDSEYAKLVPRCHYLFAVHEDDLEKVAETFAGAHERKVLLDKIDGEIRGNHEAWQKREGRRKELAEMAKWLKALAVYALGRFQ